MDEGMNKICAFMNGCCENIVVGRSERWEQIAPKIKDEKEREVIGVMIVRMMALAISTMKNANGLNYQVAPLVIRSMADCHINLFWMLADDDGKNIRQYVKDGLKEMEKRLSSPIPEGMPKELLEIIRAVREPAECYLEQQNKLWGNVIYEKKGRSKKIFISDKAEAADEMDFYKKFYAMFSGAVHSSWVEVNAYKQILDFKKWKVERNVPNEERGFIFLFGFAIVSLISHSWERLDKKYGIECQTPVPLKFWEQCFSEGDSSAIIRGFMG